MRRALFAILSFAFASVATAQNKPRQELKEVTPEKVDTAVYQRLRYRYIGPEGNRVTSVAGVPGRPEHVLRGRGLGRTLEDQPTAASTGSPIFDAQPVSSIGALAVAPCDPNVVWAGTGEPFIRSHISVGWGMYKSTDAGKTWTRAGLENTGRISRIVVASDESRTSSSPPR